MSTRRVTDSDRDFFAPPKHVEKKSFRDSAAYIWLAPWFLIAISSLALYRAVVYALSR
jgi:hypothetical protein